MKLVLAIVSSQLINDVSEALTKKDYTFTKLASIGGFREAKNTTLIVGARDEDDAEKVMAHIKEAVNNSPKKSKTEGVFDANMFVLPLREMNKM